MGKGQRRVALPKLGAKRSAGSRLRLAIIEKGYTDVKIDLGACAYIDSSGIGSHLTYRSSMNKAGGRLRLSRLRPQVYRVIELTKLISYFEIVDTVQPSPLGTIELDDFDFEN